MHSTVRVQALSYPTFTGGKNFLPLHGPCPSSKSRLTTIRACSMETATPLLQSIAVADPSHKVNKYSSRITEPKSQGGSQAILYGVGLSDEDLGKPQIGDSSVWYEGDNCDMHLLNLANAVKEGGRKAGTVGLGFNATGVTDAISMGTRGMCYSLKSRDLIADSIETVMAAQWYDGNISIPGCDKNTPGTIMAMGRLNRPSIMVYGGTIKPGVFQGHTYDIVSAFEVCGKYIHDSISNEPRMNVVHNSCPRAVACGGMYTANTMAYAIEAMGMSLPYSYSTLAPLKLEELRQAAKYRLDLIKMESKPWDQHDAMAIVLALGGSTNHVGKSGSSLTRQLGIMARDGRVVPPSLVDAKSTETLDCIWQEVMNNVLDCPLEFRPVCTDKCYKMWKDYKYSIKKKYFLLFEGALDILQWYPLCIVPEQWSDLVSYWSNDFAQSKSSQNSRNWAKLSLLHTMGGRHMQDILHEIEAEGLSTDQISVFEKIRNPSHPDVRAIMEQLHACLAELLEAERDS